MANSLPVRILNYLASNRQSDALFHVNQCYTDFVTDMADKFEVEWDDFSNALDLLEGHEYIFIIAEDPESDYIEHIEIAEKFEKQFYEQTIEGVMNDI